MSAISCAAGRHCFGFMGNTEVFCKGMGQKDNQSFGEVGYELSP
jgi:hypothetical protein